MKFSNQSRQKLSRLWDGGYQAYPNDDIKAEALRLAKRWLKHFATRLAIEEKAFSLRVNEGGVAGMGEVTLHTDPLPGYKYGIYIQVGQHTVGDKTILYRACKSIADYCGLHNNFTMLSKASINEQEETDFLNTVLKLCEKT